MTDLAEELRTLVDRVPPVGLHEIDMAARGGLATGPARRRLPRKTLAAAAVIAMIAVAGAVTIVAGGKGGRVSVVTRSRGDRPEAGIAVTLPAGWSDLSVSAGGDPNELLVAGTAPRPPGDPIDVCDTTSGSVYLSIYEYAPTGPFVVPTVASFTGPRATLTRAEFQPRPAQFSGFGPGSFGSSCTKAPPGVLVRAVDSVTFFSFQVANRLLIAKIDARDDPNLQLVHSAIAVLNSVQIQPGHYLPGSVATPGTPK
jgi:hypothetical protein